MRECVCVCVWIAMCNPRASRSHGTHSEYKAIILI